MILRRQFRTSRSVRPIDRLAVLLMCRAGTTRLAAPVERLGHCSSGRDKFQVDSTPTPGGQPRAGRPPSTSLGRFKMKSRDDGERRRTRGAAVANGVERHHVPACRLPGFIASLVRLRAEAAVSPLIRTLNQPARHAGPRTRCRWMRPGDLQLADLADEQPAWSAKTYEEQGADDMKSEFPSCTRSASTARWRAPISSAS